MHEVTGSNPGDNTTLDKPHNHKVSWSIPCDHTIYQSELAGQTARLSHSHADSTLQHQSHVKLHFHHCTCTPCKVLLHPINCATVQVNESCKSQQQGHHATCQACFRHDLSRCTTPIYLGVTNTGEVPSALQAQPLPRAPELQDCSTLHVAPTLSLITKTRQLPSRRLQVCQQ
jgi:hypothetical protein